MSAELIRDLIYPFRIRHKSVCGILAPTLMLCVCTGGVELREDLPLKSGGAGASTARCCVGGPRLILAAFAALTAAITLALLTQIYYGDYEVRTEVWRCW